MYRVFISYSHEDAEMVHKVAQIIKDEGLIPMWDKDFSFGHGFQNQIKTFIAHAHVFLPVVTESSSKRGWVHQEIGYAMALNVPVLPVAVGTLPGEMMRELHAIHLDDLEERNLEELKHKLSRGVFDDLVQSYKNVELAPFQCAQLPEHRSMMMVNYLSDVLQLKHVLELEAYGCVRQKSGLSSFNIPKAVVTDPIWAEREGEEHQQRQFYHEYLRKERQALEEHARVKGCRLIVNPYLTYEMFGTKARIARLKTLVEFLESMPDDKVQVTFNKEMLNENLTILGDWFAAESVSASPSHGYRQTIFTRHAPSIQEMIELFDHEFEGLLQKSDWGPESSRVKAISTIKDIIADLRSKTNA